MKLENEHVIGIQTPPRKSYNPFDSDDEETNDFVKSNIHGYDIKTLETNADSLTLHLDSSNLSWEEAILGHSRILGNAISADLNDEEFLSRKDPQLFTDKTVTEFEPPNLMGCYKENGFHCVKDIGIDEGVPAHDKVWIKSRDSPGSENLPCFLALNGEVNVLSFMEGLKTRSDNDLEKDASANDQAEDLMKGHGIDGETLESQHLEDQCVTDDSTKVDVFKDDSSKKEKESNSGGQSKDIVKSGAVAYSARDPQLSETDEFYHKVEKKGNEISKEYNKDNVLLEHPENSSTNPSALNEAEESKDSSERQSQEATSPQNIELPASQEQAGSGVANVLSNNSTLESGSMVFDFNAPSVSGQDEEETSQHSIMSVEKPPEPQKMSRHDDRPPSSILDSSTDKRVHGETSFSAAMPPPASITYMGPHAHSGNISLRSESSAGSTRSFAFPVLQSEWDSSPVRMAKADRRHFRKHRGWIHSLICCRD